MVPFLKRPSFYQDEGIQNQYHIDFVPPVNPKEIVNESDTLVSLLKYLNSLNLEGTSTPVPINEIRNELIDSEKLKSEIANKLKKEDSGESGDSLEDADEMGDFSQGEVGEEEK